MRPDARTETSVRTMSATVGLLNRSDGSAKFQFGKSIVLCSVFGPMAVRAKDELTDKAFLNLNFTPVSGDGDPNDRFHERFLRETAENLILTAMYPRTMIKISFQVLSDDGIVLATAMNAMIMALIDAGIPLKSTLASISCLIDKNGKLLLDPTLLELQNSQSVHTFVFDSIDNACLTFYSSGLYTEEEFEEAFNLSELAARSVHNFMKQVLAKKASK